MLTIYRWLLRLLLPFVLLRLAWRGLRNHGYWHRIPERFGFIPSVNEARRALQRRS
jgi:3-deoxy-D-manno-octulosonic-acid transferase